MALFRDNRLQRAKAEHADQEWQPELRAPKPDQAAKRSDDGSAAKGGGQVALCGRGPLIAHVRYVRSNISDLPPVKPARFVDQGHPISEKQTKRSSIRAPGSRRRPG